jgi:E3 ubiquitin-protein ligase DOA10
MKMRDAWNAAVFLSSRKGTAVGVIIGIVILAVVLVTAGIPVVSDSLTSANLSGTTKTITDQYPTFLALLGLVAIAGVMG